MIWYRFKNGGVKLGRYVYLYCDSKREILNIIGYHSVNFVFLLMLFEGAGVHIGSCLMTSVRIYQPNQHCMVFLTVKHPLLFG